MDSIQQSEYLRQAAQAPQFGLVQPQPPVVYYRTAPMPYDSYGGKKESSGFWWKAPLAIAGLVLFRGKIANVTKKYFPGLAEGVGKMLTSAKEGIKKVKGSDYLAAGWHKYVDFEKNTAQYFAKEGTLGNTVKTKAGQFWGWLKGLVLKSNKPEQM